MTWYVLILWAIITAVLFLPGNIDCNALYIGTSMMLAAEYIEAVWKRRAYND